MLIQLIRKRSHNSNIPKNLSSQRICESQIILILFLQFFGNFDDCNNGKADDGSDNNNKSCELPTDNIQKDKTA